MDRRSEKGGNAGKTHPKDYGNVETKKLIYKILHPILFRLEPEQAHKLTLFALRLGGNFLLSNLILRKIYSVPDKPVQAFGLTFKNSVGLAAGYDKDGVAIRGLSALGFGHIEIGTVTPKPQPGNPKPRVFRLLEDEAVINRMGFPSRGADFVVNSLKRPALSLSKGSNTVLGINLGKNKETPNEEAERDYLCLIYDFAPFADYLTINISSPNTPGLRQLQGRKELESLLRSLHKARMEESERLNKHVPILVKLAPDMNECELNDALDVIVDTKMDGVILTNTTLSRDGLRSKHQVESGGLSGSPLKGRSEPVLRQAIKSINGKIPVVSVGGIMSPEDAKRRLEMGAALVQVYTGLIYRGPELVKAILKSL